MTGPETPEQKARREIDVALGEAGWLVQNRDEANLAARRGVAIREFKMAKGHGFADYLLFVDQQPVGAIEAKLAGHTLTGVEGQTKKYAEGLPPELDAPLRPLPFLYQSTGVETRFTNLLDPHPRSRRVFAFHRPETMAEWLAAEPLAAWVAGREDAQAVADRPGQGEGYATRPSTLRSRLRAMPPVHLPNLWPNKRRAIENLEGSLAEDRPRALIQMATGSGKTKLAVTQIYRLIKFGGARRVLFLVDRSNLGEQALKEFQSYWTPDDNRRFTELYNVQWLTTNTTSPASKVVITTIQRLYSMLQGEDELDPELEEGSQFGLTGQEQKEPAPIVYDAKIPPEFFDFIVVDECHRSIYSLWRQVLEYFDAYLVGLTATPAKHTFGFFNRNLVMEYTHDEAVADNVNVDFEIYRIRTQITERGSTVEASPDTVLGVRDRRTRALRWEQPDENLTYTGAELDRAVVSKDQIRLIVRTFKDRFLKEMFPGRTHVPKTLIFAKDDSHAEDIVDIIREEFGRGNQFCTKITYKTTGKKPADLIQDFRTGYNPRIAVTVDMIATGTDIRPVEIVMFMRSVKSKVLFEQMKGRGVRVVSPDELRGVTPDAAAKTHFVIVDCVGITETELADTQPLERKRSVSFHALLEHVAMGGTDPEMISSLASRLTRLDKQCGETEHVRIRDASSGLDLGDITHGLIQALDPDTQVARARQEAGLAEEQAPTEEQVAEAGKKLLKEAAQPLATNPPLRRLLDELKTQFEQIIDEISQDTLLGAGLSADAREKAKALVQSFEEYLEAHKDEIDALQFFYSQPYRDRLHYGDIKALADAIGAPPRAWTPEKLWRAYELLDKDKVRGASGQRLLTDIVSLIRFALRQDERLRPFGEQVQERFHAWMQQQANKGRQFTPEQSRWLEMIRDHIATSLEIDTDDFQYAPFAQEGGLGKAAQVFGSELPAVLSELNEALAA